MRVTRAEATRDPVSAFGERHGLHVIFGRMARGDRVTVVADNAILALGDLVTVVGSEADLRAAAAFLGEIADVELDLDRRQIDYRRIFVSRPEVTERPLASLHLPQRFGAVITRVRRGDVELLPDARTQLELGDRVRVVAPRDRMDAISGCLGDSYKALSEIDVISFGLGIALGLLLGMIPIGSPVGLRSSSDPRVDRSSLGSSSAGSAAPARSCGASRTARA